MSQHFFLFLFGSRFYGKSRRLDDRDRRRKSRRRSARCWDGNGRRGTRVGRGRWRRRFRFDSDGGWRGRWSRGGGDGRLREVGRDDGLRERIGSGGFDWRRRGRGRCHFFWDDLWSWSSRRCLSLMFWREWSRLSDDVRW